MAIQRAAHVVYDTRYDIAWAPEYRKWIGRGNLRDFVEQCITEIAISNDFEIEQMQIAEDHVHILLGFPPKYSIPTVVKRLKGGSARAILERYPEVKTAYPEWKTTVFGAIVAALTSGIILIKRKMAAKELAVTQQAV